MTRNEYRSLRYLIRQYGYLDLFRTAPRHQIPDLNRFFKLMQTRDKLADRARWSKSTTAQRARLIKLMPLF